MGTWFIGAVINVVSRVSLFQAPSDRHTCFSSWLFTILFAKPSAPNSNWFIRAVAGRKYLDQFGDGKL